ncbi:hypothetical protein AAVH_39891, partial [Aphelenchoides avenae]
MSPPLPPHSQIGVLNTLTNFVQSQQEMMRTMLRAQQVVLESIESRVLENNNRLDFIIPKLDALASRSSYVPAGHSPRGDAQIIVTPADRFKAAVAKTVTTEYADVGVNTEPPPTVAEVTYKSMEEPMPAEEQTPSDEPEHSEDLKRSEEPTLNKDLKPTEEPEQSEEQ